MKNKKLFLFLANLVSLLYAREEDYFQPLSKAQQISFFFKHFLQKNLIYGFFGGIGSYVGIKLLKRKFPYLKHDTTKYLCASPFILFSLHDAHLLKNLNASGFDVLQNSNEIEKKFLSIGFENYILKKNNSHLDSQVVWNKYKSFNNKTPLFTARLVEKLLLFFVELEQFTRAQSCFSDFLLLNKKKAGEVFHKFSEFKQIKILSVLTELSNLDELNLQYDLLLQIKDHKKLLNILLSIKDTELKFKILNTFSSDDILFLYTEQKQQFCSLISGFFISSFENINSLSDFFEKLFLIQGIDEIDFLKYSERSQRASLLSCFPKKTIIKLAKTFSEKFEVPKKEYTEQHQELEMRFQSLQSFIYEQLLKDKEKSLVSWFYYVLTEYYRKSTNPYYGKSPEEQAEYEVYEIEQFINNNLQEEVEKNYDQEKINFFVYFVLSFKYIISNEKNKFLSLSQHRQFKELGSILIELII